MFLGVDLAACESDAGGDGVGDALRESVEAGQRRLNLGGGKPGKRGDGLTQTLVAAVECAPGSYGKQSFGLSQLLLVSGQAVVDKLENFISGYAQSIQYILVARDEPFSHSGRGFQACVGHPVEYGDVALVTDADGNRERELRHSDSQIVVLVCLKVGGGATASDNHYAVEFLLAVGDAA